MAVSMIPHFLVPIRLLVRTYVQYVKLSILPRIDYCNPIILFSKRYACKSAGFKALPLRIYLILRTLFVYIILP